MLSSIFVRGQLSVEVDEAQLLEKEAMKRGITG